MSDSNHDDLTRDLDDSSTPGGGDSLGLERVGRYRIEKLIGRGGFGLVYLARDESLDRRVAIKVPHSDLIKEATDADAYLAEARMAALLEHPNIVTVHDVGSTDECACYVVSRYIDGMSLAEYLRRNRLKWDESTKLVATIAEALHYAHRKGLVHRDIKPGNILLDRDGQPHIVDFGLALRDDNLGGGPTYAGTPAYMSPEQARGEGHRIDGRSDIFSLGVVFYRLLVGKPPFRGDTKDEVIDQVTRFEPRPLRQYDAKLPKELARICHKALSKRASERYTTAQDMADDLQQFIDQSTAVDNSEHKTTANSTAEPISQESPSTIVSGQTPSATSVGSSVTFSQPIKVVPKGLRAFDREDSDFFLELVPGPRDRHGLPDSLRFWKSRLEETDGDNTFSVGLLYGPSGCGKSSLVRAGLLPRLSEDILPIYVEATGEGTEARLLRGLRKKFPELAEDATLKETLAAIRRGRGAPRDSKVLLVLDQFEQWLHANEEDEEAPLVQALRQCDGGRLQCVIMVRDDFWMAVTRFLRALEVDLVQGQNFAAVDLFPIRHAKQVLAAFGRAFGALPETPDAMSPSQKEFLEKSVAGLAREGKVFCVRLALFAEMMKDRQWTTASLKEVGGAEGVGVAFLESTFSARTNPAHRRHERAARAVLQALLPESGADIKGHMRSYAELLEVSRYGDRPREFDDLIRILDSEIRLITPTDAEGVDLDDSSRPTVVQRTDERYYQLTHDYLVHSLRDWLTRKQRETRRGRAELMLGDLTATWADRRENRFLPTLREFSALQLLTRRGGWTGPQRDMMRQATKVHGLRCGVFALVLAACAIGAFAIYDSIRSERARSVAAGEQRERAGLARGLVESLLTADIEQTPRIIEQMAPHRDLVDDRLRAEFEKATGKPSEKTRLALALLPIDAQMLLYLGDELLRAGPDEAAVIQDAVRPNGDEIAERIWPVALEDRDPARRFRAACALSQFTPDDPRWAELDAFTAGELTRVLPSQLAPYREQLKPVKNRLIPHLTAVYRDPAEREQIRSFATDTLIDFAFDKPDVLFDLLADAEVAQFPVLLDALRVHASATIPLAEAELRKAVVRQWNEPAPDGDWASPGEGLESELSEAQGVLGDRYAFCLSTPLKDFETLDEQLRNSGYRPVRLRPWLAKEMVLAAAVWTRDGAKSKVVFDLTAEALRTADSEARKSGLEIVDASVYRDREGAVKYAGVWAERNDSQPSKLFLSDGDWPSKTKKLPSGWTAISWRTTVDSQQQRRHAAVLVEASEAATVETNLSLRELQTLATGQMAWDAASYQAPVLVDSAARYARQLKESEARLEKDANDLDALQQRAVARYFLQEDDAAIKDLTTLIDKKHETVEALRYRSVLHARKKDRAQALADLEAFRQQYVLPGEPVYVAAMVHLQLGDYDTALAELETAVARHPDDDAYLAPVARAYAAAVRLFPDKAETCLEQSQLCLQRAVSFGFGNVEVLQSDPDLETLRKAKKLDDLIADLLPARRYSLVTRASTAFETQTLLNVGIESHAALVRQKLAAGFRPQAVTVFSQPSGEAVVDSIWRRPVIVEDEREQLAKRQANAAVALYRMGRSNRVWALLKSGGDNRLRSLLIHRFSQLGCDPRLLINRLDSESDVSIRRALYLALGEYSFDDIATRDRDSLTARAGTAYEQNDDPGVHGAVRWLLRQWKQQETIDALDKQLAQNEPKRKATLSEQRRWYVNAEGQTFAILEPGQFQIGSPPSEPHHANNEVLHLRRITHRLAVATTEVTHEQFVRFQKERAEIKSPKVEQWVKTDDSPQVAMTWYEAAAYCNWLSDRDGIPDTQWCYQPNEQGNYAAGMRARDGYLELSGYRLPTGPEWEYACRSGSTTSRYYGASDELFAKYAWGSTNAQDQTWPVGSLKPNDWGLFDMHGNVFEWCHEEFRNYRVDMTRPSVELQDLKPVDDSTNRILRGGAFYFQPPQVRSAIRFANPATAQSYTFGFRPVRTLKDRR